MEDCLISAITDGDLDLVDDGFDEAFEAITTIMEAFGIQAIQAGTVEGIRHLRSNAEVQAAFDKSKMN